MRPISPLRFVLVIILCGCLFSCSDQLPSSKLPDFKSYTDVKAKKKAFFDFMLPMIKAGNQEILEERELVISLQQKYADSDQGKVPKKLQQLLDKYRVQEDSREAEFASLLIRINSIPPSLVMAQAANESAWGTSRFAIEGNNLFGQWCFSKGCGIVPSQRAAGDIHEVTEFKTPLASVRSYMLNLNRHARYTNLRHLREQQIKQQGYATGLFLAAGLLGYSEKGSEYVKEIRGMIRTNHLESYDRP